MLNKLPHILFLIMLVPSTVFSQSFNVFDLSSDLSKIEIQDGDKLLKKFIDSGDAENALMYDLKYSIGQDDEREPGEYSGCMIGTSMIWSIAGMTGGYVLALLTESYDNTYMLYGAIGGAAYGALIMGPKECG